MASAEPENLDPKGEHKIGDSWTRTAEDGTHEHYTWNLDGTLTIRCAPKYRC